MKLGTVGLSVGILLLVAASSSVAQDHASYYGASWGITRTFWSSQASDEGYPRAGTAGLTLSLRRVRQLSDRWALAPYLQYFWMRSIVSSLACDSCYQVLSERSYFREIDLGLNLQVYPVKSYRDFYLGGGPLVRWGQAGRRERYEPRPGYTAKAAWFGLSAVAGWQRSWGDGLIAFVEPQLIFSPDEADRWQKVYPPDNLVVQMGIMWR